MMCGCIMLLCSDPFRECLNREFVDDLAYNSEIVKRASKSFVPLVLWAIAQLTGHNLSIFHTQVPSEDMPVSIFSNEMGCG